MLAMLAMLASACSPLGALDLLVPDAGHVASTGIPYRDGLALDVYRPDRWGADGPATAAVWIYGGAWRSGSREGYRFVAEYLAGQGIATVIPDYGLYPDARFPAFLEDLAAAVRWTLDGGGPEVLGRSVDRLVLMGHSAGAYNAAMLALDPRWLGADRGRISALVGLAGPYDVHPYTVGITRKVFGHVTAPETVEPLDDVGPQAPPVFLAHGLDDTTVAPGHTRKLAEAYRAAGLAPSLVTLADAGHIGLLLKLAAPLRDPALTDPLGRFLDRITSFSNSQRRSGHAAFEMTVRRRAAWAQALRFSSGPRLSG